MFFRKRNEKLVLYFFKNFLCSVENFPCSLFMITCNQRLNLFFSRTFFMITRTFRLEQFINCFNYVKIWLFKKFVTEFSWVHWNVREKNGLSWRKPSSQLLGKLSMSRKKEKAQFCEFKSLFLGRIVDRLIVSLCLFVSTSSS